MELWSIFLTGLSVGGLTCLAVQGGLLASTIALRTGETVEKSNRLKTHVLLPVTAFLTTKLIAYTFLGFLLGWFGQTLQVSDGVRIVMQIVAGVYMLAVAGNLLNLHPIFRYAIIQPPRFLVKLVRNQSKSQDLFAPALLGLFTIFIPCGTTLAIEAKAITAGNPFWGAAMMAAFTIGTIPLFVALGFLTYNVGETFKRNFYRLAAILLIYLGVTTLNAGLVLADSPITLQTLKNASPIEVDLSGGRTATQAQTGTMVAGAQVFDINVLQTGYNPDAVKAKVGQPLVLNLKTNGISGCTSVFKMPKMGISKVLPPTGTTQVQITPDKPGMLVWTCGMGMYTGGIEVI